jgi:four helix bundle protein
MYFKDLDVYQLAIRHLTLAQQLLGEVPLGHREVRDQLRRASLSIPLNVAEGAGKTKRADQRRFFSIARGSTMECAALVDVCRVLGIGPASALDEADAMLLSLVRMLSKMSLEQRQQ